MRNEELREWRGRSYRKSSRWGALRVRDLRDRVLAAADGFRSRAKAKIY